MENGVLAALFDQTVTVYHPTFVPQFSCRRQVLTGVSYQWSRTSSLGTLGKSRTGRALMGESLGGEGCLRIYCRGRTFQSWEAPAGENTFSLALGDKILPGEGPEILTRDQWDALVPALAEGVTAVRRITPYQLGSRLILVEGKGE